MKNCTEFFCQITLISLFSMHLQCLFSANTKSWQVLVVEASPAVQLQLSSACWGRMDSGKVEHILLGLVHPLRSGGSGPAERWPGRSAGPGAGSAAAHWELTPSSGIPLEKKRDQIPSNPSFIWWFLYFMCVPQTLWKSIPVSD